MNDSRAGCRHAVCRPQTSLIGQSWLVEWPLAIYQRNYIYLQSHLETDVFIDQLLVHNSGSLQGELKNIQYMYLKNNISVHW